MNWFLRHKILAGVVLSVVALFGIVTVVAIVVLSSQGNDLKGQFEAVSQSLATPAVAPSVEPALLGYNDPKRLEAAITMGMNATTLPTDPTLGRVTSTACVPSGEHQFDCALTWSVDNWTGVTSAVVVSTDGSTWTWK